MCRAVRNHLLGSSRTLAQRVHNHRTADREAAYGEQGDYLRDLRLNVQEVTKESEHREDNREDIQPIWNINSGQVGIAKTKLQEHRCQSYGGHHNHRSRTEESGAVREGNNYGEAPD